MNNITPEGKLLNVIKQGQIKMKIKKELKIFTKINIVLIGLIIIILAIFLVDIFISDSTLSDLDMELYKSGEEEVVPIIEPPEEELPDIVVEEKVVTISKEELIKDLNLMGIITGNKNQAIIEDKKEKRTLFLYEGDSIRELRVYEIKENEVILEYKGEKIELKM